MTMTTFFVAGLIFFMVLWIVAKVFAIDTRVPISVTRDRQGAGSTASSERSGSWDRDNYK